MIRLTPALIALTLLCSVPGRVLHVDNRETIPYSAEDNKLKKRVVGSLVRHRLITAEQRFTCQVNIMLIGSDYIIEVFPDGISSKCRFGVKLKRPLLRPVERYVDCRKEAETDTTHTH